MALGQQADHQVLGPYTVGPKIGGGGMAAVYLGQYAAVPGEEPPEGQEVVALKIVKGDLAKQRGDYEKMFLDEARILTMLHHPNVIRTVGYGAQAGMWFIAMELLMGRSLLDVFEAATEAKKALPYHIATWIAREVARGLHHAHELVDEETGQHLALVHRDVNPSNVFVGYDGSIKLIDFGLAKAHGRQTKSDEGIIKGKIPYLSPEQILENHVDRRTDIYALGTTLWEMSTMRRLFKRDTDVATIRAIERAEIPDPRTFLPDYPAPLWKVVERALWRDKEGRYQTAAELADDLDQIVGSRSDAEVRAQLAQLVETLFPTESKKQRDWLVEATGVDRESFVPPVPLADVPPREVSEMYDASIPPPSPEDEPRPSRLRETTRAPSIDFTPDSQRDVSLAATKPSLSEPAPAPPKERARPSNAPRDFMVALAVGAMVGLALIVLLRAM